MSAVSAVEQYLLELTNKARLDPLAMAQSFAINLNDGLAPGTISAKAKQPLAMSGILLETADFHGDWVLANNSFGTVGALGSTPGDRMAYAGFNGGGAFDWAENIAWRQTSVTPEDLGYAQQIWRSLFVIPEARAALLAEDFNEIGLSIVAGLIGGTNKQGYVLNQDIGDSDAVFITGSAYVNTNYDWALVAPEGVGGVDIKGLSGEAVTRGTGGYRLAVEAGRQQVKLGDIKVAVTVGDENIQLDLIGGNVIRSSHSVTILSQAKYAELMGVGDVSLVAGSGAGAISLYGNNGDNRLVGNGSANIIDGRAGDDVMQGGAGNDKYIVDSIGDQVIERAGGGFDEISTTASFKLAATSEVELIYATHSIFWDPIDLTGSRFAQELRGNHGNNRLDGGGGGDTLFGWKGDDTYIVRHAADRVMEWANEGYDRVQAAKSFVLGDGQEIELMETINASLTTAISLTGNSFDQTLLGNAGRNTLRGMGGFDRLEGGAGVDKLAGGAGRDMLFGGTGTDYFVFEAASDSPFGDDADVIQDWESIDRIDLSALDANSNAAGSQALAFVGKIAGSAALAAGKVGYYHSGNNTYVVANLDADSPAEFQVRLAGVHDLVLNDFVLI